MYFNVDFNRLSVVLGEACLSTHFKVKIVLILLFKTKILVSMHPFYAIMYCYRCYLKKITNEIKHFDYKIKTTILH